MDIGRMFILVFGTTAGVAALFSPFIIADIRKRKNPVRRQTFGKVLEKELLGGKRYLASGVGKKSSGAHEISLPEEFFLVVGYGKHRKEKTQVSKRIFENVKRGDEVILFLISWGIISRERIERVRLVP